MEALTKKHCKPCEGGVPPLAPEKVRELLSQLENWELKEEGKAISRHFQFSDYYKTMAFVNAVAWISHQEDHHPDMEVSYNFCRVRYSTHAIGGLSENDFICAAKVDGLIRQK
jgi:4a-hydroxytetrahydrobiopterin dehydratase